MLPGRRHVCWFDYRPMRAAALIALLFAAPGPSNKIDQRRILAAARAFADCAYVADMDLHDAAAKFSTALSEHKVATDRAIDAIRLGAGVAEARARADALGAALHADEAKVRAAVDRLVLSVRSAREAVELAGQSSDRDYYDCVLRAIEGQSTADFARQSMIDWPTIHCATASGSPAAASAYRP